MKTNREGILTDSYFLCIFLLYQWHWCRRSGTKYSVWTVISYRFSVLSRILSIKTKQNSVIFEPPLSINRCRILLISWHCIFLSKWTIWVFHPNAQGHSKVATPTFFSEQTIYRQNFGPEKISAALKNVHTYSSRNWFINYFGHFKSRYIWFTFTIYKVLQNDISFNTSCLFLLSK